MQSYTRSPDLLTNAKLLKVELLQTMFGDVFKDAAVPPFSDNLNVISVGSNTVGIESPFSPSGLPPVQALNLLPRGTNIVGVGYGAKTADGSTE